MFGEIHAIQPFFVNNTTQYYKKMLPDTPYVHFYSFTANTAKTAVSAAVPDCCADILFSFFNGEAEGFLYGFVTKKDKLKLRPGADYFGVRFRPGFLPECLGVSLTELIDARIPLSDLPEVATLSEKMATMGTEAAFSERMELLFKFFGDKWINHQLLKQFTDLISKKNGICRVNELEDMTLYSTRYINKIFKSNIGVSPKAFSRYVRLQRLIYAMNNQNYSSFSAMAADFGYFDQAHLSKEFKQLTSVTPREYLDVINVADYKRKLVYI
ncbi:MAG: helix-turn-helix domain-containing protein [Defluviitaleaceae bacterium]|nr:helix-turn-helix domain-containing protein [Defluviitaleaceae bacterium]